MVDTSHIFTEDDIDAEIKREKEGITQAEQDIKYHQKKIAELEKRRPEIRYIKFKFNVFIQKVHEDDNWRDYSGEPLPVTNWHVFVAKTPEDMDHMKSANRKIVKDYDNYEPIPESERWRSDLDGFGSPEAEEWARGRAAEWAKEYNTEIIELKEEWL